ncbi:MAG: MBL fold metallo-hydrolase [Phycisphaerales bacterium JB058]|jgi:phosphoribosyl 1,2-cyclic phosphodiesterase
MPEQARPFQLRVLASGSSGNCSVITYGQGLTTRACLLDAGLSPRRTRTMLADMGIRFDQLDHILVTHFDRDHFHPGWQAAKLDRIRIHAHADHSPSAHNTGVRPRHFSFFDEPFSLWDSLNIDFARLAHDAQGVTAFRLENDLGSLGYATDLGRPAPELVRSLHGVGTLAIESNYCPKMQLASNRPAFLKKRIMGGAGHLSNQEAAEAVREIAPGAHVVLLHLSRQCNRPEIALVEHAGTECEVIVSSQFEHTDWIPVAPARAARLPEPPPVQPSLFASPAS